MDESERMMMHFLYPSCMLLLDGEEGIGSFADTQEQEQDTDENKEKNEQNIN